MAHQWMTRNTSSGRRRALDETRRAREPLEEGPQIVMVYRPVRAMAGTRLTPPGSGRLASVSTRSPAEALGGHGSRPGQRPRSRRSSPRSRLQAAGRHPWPPRRLSAGTAASCGPSRRRESPAPSCRPRLSGRRARSGHVSPGQFSRRPTRRSRHPRQAASWRRRARGLARNARWSTLAGVVTVWDGECRLTCALSARLSRASARMVPVMCS
jgi:hypothetical protein